MSRMNIDVVGKVNNTRLSYKNGVMALFEAITNAMQSIEDAKLSPGSILIEIARGKSLFDGQTDVLLPIDSIKITDDGEGFIERNFTSFLSSDSTYKLNRGGKGIGRFSWLKVFDHVTIESAFVNDGSLIKRSFEFVNHKDGIMNEKYSSGGSMEAKTSVTLKHIKSGYLEKFPRDVRELSELIIEHFIIRFVSGNCPMITIRDNSDPGSADLNLNRFFDKEFMIGSDADSFTINSYVFNVGLLKVHAVDKSTNSIYLSGNDRIVKHVNLSKYTPSLSKPLLDLSTDELFCIKALVTSVYLDANVNNERTKFSLRAGDDDDDNIGDLIADITLREIERRTAEVVEAHFEEYLVELRAAKKTNMESIVYTDFPQFIPLLSIDNVVDSITEIQLSDKNKLNLALQKAKYDILLRTKQEIIDIKSSIDNITKENATPEILAEYKLGFDKLVTKLTKVTKSELAEYVLHRRVLLDIFEKVLSKRDDGTYPWEEEIHNLIFPKGKSSSDMLGIPQNLWLIDERLSYHRFVASDQSLDKKQKTSGKPDVLVGKQVTSESTLETEFDTPIAYSDETRFAAYDSMVILEFKRAMRNEYAGDKDPINQIIGYIRQIRNGKAKHPNGRPITVSPNCRFYAYLICDLVPDLKVDIEEAHEFTPMVDGNGLFAMKDKINSYIEVISYDKILFDSTQRNQVLFEKLQIDFKSTLES